MECEETDDISGLETEMTSVIDILSSDDEDEPSQRLPARVQNTVAGPVCKKEWDIAQSTGPAYAGVEERYMNGGASTSGQAHGSSVQIIGKMREDVRLAEPSPSDSLCRQFWQAGNYEVHPPKRRRVVQGMQIVTT